MEWMIKVKKDDSLALDNDVFCFWTDENPTLLHCDMAVQNMDILQHCRRYRRSSEGGRSGSKRDIIT